MMPTSTVNSSLLRFVIIIMSSSNHVDIVTLTSAAKPLMATSSANLVPATTVAPTAVPATTPSANLVPTTTPSATLIPTTTPSATLVPTTTPSATLVPATTVTVIAVPASTSSATLVLTTTPSAILVFTTTPSATPVPTTTPSATLVPSTTPSATLVPATTVTVIAVPVLTSSATLVPTTTPSATLVFTTKLSATLIPTKMPSATLVPTTTPSATLVPTVTVPTTRYTSRHMSETPAPTTALPDVTALTISVYVLTALLVLENTLIIVIIRKTSYLRSHTGALLVSQACADIMFYVALQCQFYPKKKSQSDANGKMKETCYILSLGLTGVTIITFAAMSCNLYVAACHSNFYRKHMKKLYLNLFIIISWVVNLSLTFTRLANFTTRTNQKSGEVILVYVPANAWSWVMCDIAVYGLPPLVNAFCYIKIWTYVRKIQRIPNSNINLYEMVKVTKFTSGTCLCYILASVFSHTFRVLYGTFEPWPEYIGPFRILWLSFSSFLFVYHFLKIVIYMFLYQPFLHTISLMCRKDRDESRE